MRVNQRIRTHSENVLIQQLFFKIMFLRRKQNNDLIFHIVILKVQTFILVCYERVHAFSAGFWVL
jgi:hypothetical protein